MLLRKSRQSDSPSRRPHWIALAALAVAVGLMFLPPAANEAVRDPLSLALRPAQVMVSDGCQWCAAQRTALAERFAADGQHQQMSEQLVASEQHVQQLEAELEQARLAPRPEAAVPHLSARATDPLLVSELVTARVLGQQSRALLGRYDLIDAGTGSEIQPDAFVLNPSQATLDLGDDEGLEPGRLVLAGPSVWGKVLHVGPVTSTVRRITDPGYRDLVQLASVIDGRIVFGPRGVLEGTGDRLCRIGLVEGVEPVAVGDRVYAADTEGLLAAPLLYGTIVRAELPSGAAHWEITMRPAAGSGDIRQLSVLRTQLNPQRVAAQEQSTSSKK